MLAMKSKINTVAVTIIGKYSGDLLSIAAPSSSFKFKSFLVKNVIELLLRTVFSLFFKAKPFSAKAVKQTFIELINVIHNFS